MHANSRPIHSAQTEIHEQLTRQVSRHASATFLKPILDHNRAAFDASISIWHANGCPPLILDAGCGVGLSTLHLATHFPGHFVIGVDQSEDRLSRNTIWNGPRPENCIQVRADLVDYWRLLLMAGIPLARHYILYPNPWPKIGQLGRRWHGHPVFPFITQLGGELECRSNWRIYIEEFSAALRQLTDRDVLCESYSPLSPITPFEQKYLASGHALWRCTASLSPARSEKRYPEKK